MRALVTRYPAIAFIALTYVLTISVWTAILRYFGAMPIEGLFSSPTGIVLVYAGAGAPTIVALILTAWISGRSGLKNLLSRVKLLRVSPFLWMAAFGVPILLGTITTVMSSGQLGVAQFPIWYAIIPPSALLLFFAGPLCEEIGWRGFLQPILLAQMSPLKAATIIGTVWCFWHIPLSFTPGTTPALDGVGRWAIYWLSTFASSAIIMTIVVSGRGSIPLAMAFHWSGNAAFSHILQPIFPSATPSAWQGVGQINIILSTVLAIACLFWLSRHFSKPDQPSHHAT